MKNNKGFTLIELLAVILILGIIALIAIPTVNSVIEQSRKGAAESSGNELVKGAEQWHTICLIEDSTGAGCNIDFLDVKHPNAQSSYSSNDLKNDFSIKGDVPEIGDIKFLVFNDEGEAYISYTDGNYKCSNVVTAASANSSNKVFVYDKPAGGRTDIIGTANVINSDGVKCAK